MDTLQLKLFLSLAKTLNFTKTANEFYVTQPTVSNYIKSLESSLNVKLLNRDSRSVSLTPEGMEFINYANRMLSLQADAEERLKNIAEGRQGHIKIGILSSSTEIFSKCLAEFSRKYTRTQVDVRMLEGSEMITAFSRRSFDLYFALSHMVPENDKVNSLIISNTSLSLFVHKDIASDINMEDWSTLRKFRFISAPENEFSLFGKISRICANRGFTPDIINYFNRADTLLLAVNSGLGITILPQEMSTFYNFSNVISIPIPGDDAALTTMVVWHSDNPNPDVKNFLALQTLRNAIKSAESDSQQGKSI